jgi:hypothetical protein
MKNPSRLNLPKAVLKNLSQASEGRLFKRTAKAIAEIKGIIQGGSIEADIIIEVEAGEDLTREGEVAEVGEEEEEEIDHDFNKFKE